MGAVLKQVRPQGKRERRKAVTRKDLLAAGRELFGAKGLYESRVDEITDRAGIAKGTLYKYFENKETLIHDVVAQGFQELWRQVDERVSGARGMDDVVARIVEAHDEFFSRNPDMLRIFHQVRGLLKFNRPEWGPLRGILSAHVGRLARHIGRPAEGAALSPSRRREMAMALFGAFSGAVSVRVSLEPREGAGTVPRALRRALVAMARELARGPTAGVEPRR